MSIVAQRDIVTTRFVAFWPTSNPVAPVPVVAYANRNEATIQGAGKPWARFSVVGGLDEQTGIAGAARGSFASVGIVNVQCFVPANSGDRVATLMADHALNCFRGYNSTGLWFYQYELSEQIEDTNSPWYGVLARSYFRYNRIENYS